MSGGNDIVLGSVSFSPAYDPVAPVIDAMAQSIVDLLTRLAEVEQQRDFYKMAAEQLSKGRRKK
jgi:hypothetical protein